MKKKFEIYESVIKVKMEHFEGKFEQMSMYVHEPKMILMIYLFISRILYICYNLNLNF